MNCGILSCDWFYWKTLDAQVKRRGKEISDEETTQDEAWGRTGEDVSKVTSSHPSSSNLALHPSVSAHFSFCLCMNNWEKWHVEAHVVSARERGGGGNPLRRSNATGVCECVSVCLCVCVREELKAAAQIKLPETTCPFKCFLFWRTTWWNHTAFPHTHTHSYNARTHSLSGKWQNSETSAPNWGF